MSKYSKTGRMLLVTGLAGAGKSTVLDVLEDLGWEVVDNLPLGLLEPLLAEPRGGVDGGGNRRRPLAIGLDCRSRGFTPDKLMKRVKALRKADFGSVETLFVDCADAELERRFSETRRRHPLARDRPAADGIAREREVMEPLRAWSDQLVDTTNFTNNDLQADIRQRFNDDMGGQPVLTILSFGFARGLPRNADLVFDVRFLSNPHWVPELRPLTGLDPRVAAHVAADPSYDAIISQIERLLCDLLPRYAAEGKSYVTIGFGCTGGRHRSVHVAERVTATLIAAGFNPVIHHRNLDSLPLDGLEGEPVRRTAGAS